MCLPHQTMPLCEEIHSDRILMQLQMAENNGENPIKDARDPVLPFCLCLCILCPWCMATPLKIADHLLAVPLLKTMNCFCTKLKETNSCGTLPTSLDSAGIKS